jgi:hypothetical protein
LRQATSSTCPTMTACATWAVRPESALVGGAVWCCLVCTVLCVLCVLYECCMSAV